ncbi:MAG: UvrD-helicase domain-containing protein [Gemmatimonadaceae bacterium]
MRSPPHVPSALQREAIEAHPGPILVLAGPGAGKTFCLIERIRFLIERLGYAPERICAFTFTNKAADEIALRLDQALGGRGAGVKTGTIHSFCAELLREFGAVVGLADGFGIADDDYQHIALRRIGVPARSHRSLLEAMTAHRFRGHPASPRDAERIEQYERFLEERSMVDFDMLLLRAAELLRDPQVAARIRSRWDCVLVDEFQDLNNAQYSVIRGIGDEHRRIFAVGDHEQSIYSWAGADPRVFRAYVNDFGITSWPQLLENHRCPSQVMGLARTLVARNPSLLGDRMEVVAPRSSPHPVVAYSFPDEAAEIAWVIADIRRDREAGALRWGDYALLYRKHELGNFAEAGFLAEHLPCRLAPRRALGEDPAVAYVIAAIRVISSDDDVHKEAFMGVVLPGTLADLARSKAEQNKLTFLQQLHRMAVESARDDGDAKKIRRGFYAMQNLHALGMRHVSLTSLVEELLSQRVGEYGNTLEENHDALTDPLGHDEVVRLASRLEVVLEHGAAIRVPRLGGLEIPLKGMLLRLGVRHVELGDTPREGVAESIEPADDSSLGIALTLFKAAQLVRSRHFESAFRDFTAVDLETTDHDIAGAEIVEIAAVRVRDGRLVDTFHSLVRPRVPVDAQAAKVHRITDADLARAQYFEEVWPRFRAFCGGDVLVAHNGHEFDFPILGRMAARLPGGADICTYDTLPLARALCAGSARLSDLARRFGIDPGRSHRAGDDARTLARVFLALERKKVERARKTALPNLLDQLGVALALSDVDPLDAEAALLKRVACPYALGRYSDCLDFYRDERERAGDRSLPTVGDLIDRLGGEATMRRIRAEKTADQRYPSAMARLRQLLGRCSERPLPEQITQLLEWTALSVRSDGVDPEPDRVNLLTLHSTKGLEFSRVYILGVEDAELPGMWRSRSATALEIEEARRLLYVGMTRAKDRLVMTRVAARRGQRTGGHRFLDEIGLVPQAIIPRALMPPPLVPAVPQVAT